MCIKKNLILNVVLLVLSVQQQALAMSDTTQAVVVTSTAGLINAGTAIYMQGQGMNPQFVTAPTGATTVVPGGSGANYESQNQQNQKQAFFNGNS